MNLNDRIYICNNPFLLSKMTILNDVIDRLGQQDVLHGDHDFFDMNKPNFTVAFKLPFPNSLMFI